MQHHLKKCKLNSHAPGAVCSSKEGFSPCAKMRTMLNPADTAWQAARQHHAIWLLKLNAQLRRCTPYKEVTSLCKGQVRTWSNMEVTPFDAVKAEPAGLPPQLQCLRHTAPTLPINLLPTKAHKLRAATTQQLNARSGTCNAVACQENVARLPTNHWLPRTLACPGQPSCAATQAQRSAMRGAQPVMTITVRC